jgi:putative nucleotidyltransferase with HDIG domain
MLSRSMEVKDWETSGHTERVADIAVALARRLGYRGSDLEAIEVGALVHDIGKIGVPEQILHKPGPLDDAEWDLMKQHPVIAEYILSGIDLPPIVHEIARWSHEHVDGAGYPDGLAGNAIPLSAQIAFVADAFDAITTDRPYRRRRGTLTALQEIRAHSGTQFSREVVRALEEPAREEPAPAAGGRRARRTRRLAARSARSRCGRSCRARHGSSRGACRRTACRSRGRRRGAASGS